MVSRLGEGEGTLVLTSVLCLMQSICNRYRVQSKTEYSRQVVSLQGFHADCSGTCKKAKGLKSRSQYIKGFFKPSTLPLQWIATMDADRDRHGTLHACLLGSLFIFSQSRSRQ